MIKDDVLDQTSLPTMEDIRKMGLGTNEIIENTSGDRSHVVAAIRLLKKEKLLREGEKWKHGYKKNIRPTALALEILKMIEDIAIFNKSNQDFFPLIESERNDFVKNKVEPLGLSEDYSKATGHSKYEFFKLAEYHYRLGNMKIMLTNFMFSILIFRFTDLNHRYKPKRDGTKILQKIIMDQISSLLADTNGWASDNDPHHAIENLDSSWRQVLFMQTGFKIINDIYGFYANNEITLDEVLRAKTRKVFWSILNLLNPPKSLIELHLNFVQDGIRFSGEELYEIDGTPRVAKSREAIMEDLKTIFLNNQQYLQRYTQYIRAFDSS